MKKTITIIDDNESLVTSLSIQLNLSNYKVNKFICPEKAIEYLKAYQKKWDEHNQCFRNKPLHSYASHCADAFRTGIVGQGANTSNWKKQIPVNTNYIV